jgi:hypothetical protein
MTNEPDCFETWFSHCRKKPDEKTEMIGMDHILNRFVGFPRMILKISGNEDMWKKVTYGQLRFQSLFKRLI